MAESIICSAVANILSSLSSPAVKELGLLWGVNEELDKLDDTFSAIQAVLLDIDQEQLSQSNRAKNWVSRLKEVVHEIEDLMDECGYEALRAQVLAKDTRRVRKQVRMLFSIFKRPYSNLKLAHKIKHIRERLKAIDDDKNQFSFSPSVLHTSPSDHHHHQFKKERETYSFIFEDDVIGRSDDKDEIIKLLFNTNTKDDIAIISIVGMGGLGKTTLAQAVYNDDKITKHFELKLWVCVSEDFDVKTIVRNIIESATKEKPKSNLIEVLQEELRNKIKKKKYLLVMDDVWNEDSEKWDNLKRLLGGGANGSRILITTRGQKVADTHNSSFSHSLGVLNEGDSWFLFKKMTLLKEQGDESEDANLIEIGWDIVKKLRGVPLVIRTIGRLLKDKKSPTFWLFFKDKELCQVMEQVKNNDLDYMLSILELSYKHLPANLKQCFLYCALFPKDYVIVKDELILLWKAQGFIPPNNKDELIDIGEYYFLELLSKSFFQEVTKDAEGNIYGCKMHDLMHDLACSIGNNESICGLQNNMDKRTRHFSLNLISLEEFRELPKTLSKIRNLRTLLLDQCFLEDQNLKLDKLFMENYRLRALKVHFSLDLDRRETGLVSIIGRFKHLRYLSISGLDLKYLPNCLTKLYNLETLSLRDLRYLEKLPCDFKNLINLKFLTLFSIDRLKFLPNSITELCKLEELTVLNCGSLEELPIDIKKMVNLKHLCIRSCFPLDHMPKRLVQLSEFVLRKNNNGSDLDRLVTISLVGCYRLQHLPQFHQLPYLKNLFLEALPNVEYFFNDDFDSSSIPFPFLENLTLSYMPKLKRWLKSTASTESNKPTEDSLSIIFPLLSHLHVTQRALRILKSMQTPLLKVLIIRDSWEHPMDEDEFDAVPLLNWKNLSSLTLSYFSKWECLPNCLQHATTLQYLFLNRCGNLKSLPEWTHNLTSLTKLEIQNCKNLRILRHIPSLRSLKIVDCPILEERCKKDNGEDWPKIAHIPQVYFSRRFRRT